MLYPREEFSVTTRSGLSHSTKFAASSKGMPGRTPTTSSTGVPGDRSADGLAGHLTSPRISFATCSAVAEPVEPALDGWPTSGPDFLESLHPPARRETAVNTPIAHNRWFIAFS